MMDVSEAGQRFGGVFDLSRSLFHNGQATTLVCNACQTVNRQSAQYCKGCAGKLPLFYASQRPTPAARSQPRPGRYERACAAVRPSPARQRGVQDFNSPAVGVALLIVVLFAAFGYWFTGHALARPSVPSMLMTSSETLAPDAGLNTPYPRRPTLIAEQVPRRAPASAVAYGLADAESTPPLRSARAVPVARIQVQRRAAPEPVRRVASSPVAACNALNFFARAVCLNNRCAERSLSRDPACNEVHRQQRMAEARRNPSMIN